MFATDEPLTWLPPTQPRSRGGFAMLTWLNAGVLVWGCTLPMYHAADGRPTALLEAGDGRFTVFVFLVAAMLVVPGTLTLVSPGVAAVASGAAFFASVAFGLIVGIHVLWLSTDTSQYGPPSRFDETVALGTYVVGIGAALALATTLAGLTSLTTFERRSEFLTRLSGAGVIAGIICSVGWLMAPPDYPGGIKARLSLDNFALNVVLVLLCCLPALFGLLGFLAKEPWGIRIVAGVYVPVAWVGLSASTASPSDDLTMQQDAISRILVPGLNPVFAIGLILMGGCVLLGLLAPVPMPPPEASDPPLPPPWLAQVAATAAAPPSVPAGGAAGPATPWTAGPMPAAGSEAPVVPVTSSPSTSTKVSRRAASKPAAGRPAKHAGRRGGRWSLVLEDGTRHPMTPNMLIGSHPEVTAIDPPSSLITVEDPEGFVAPTHLAAGVADGAAWVLDRGTGFGSGIVGPDAVVYRLPDRQRVPVEPGTVVYVGNRPIRFEQERR